jgi:hypothetical protein
VPVELQQHQHLVAERQQPLSGTGLRELDAVASDIDLGDARLGVQQGEHLPELRVNRRLAADELYRVERAFLFEQVADVLAKGVH